MSSNDFDVIVIGTGPAGEGASMKASKEGKSVAVVERNSQVGGGCTHWGTIPSKALREAIRTTLQIKNHPMFKKLAVATNGRMSVTDMLASAASVVQAQVHMRETFYSRNHVPVLHGSARFVDAHTIEVEGAGGSQRYSAEHFVIATGSRPYRPDDIDFSHPRVYDADTVLGMDHNPRSMTIYGAGVIGCEYASMFRKFGVKVNLVNTRRKLLEFLDDEVIDALSYHLRDMGTIIRHDEHYDRVEGVDDGVVLHLKSNKQLKTDAFLWANGRAPNTETLGLDAAGVELAERGRVKVNENYQTSQAHIYAAGDVIGPPGLASASYDQGRFAARHMIKGQCDHHLVSDIPTGIYTMPEISSIGATERELTEDGVPYEVGHAFFKSIARAQITGNTTGMLKLLFHVETMAILGIHCFGANASEIIHIGQAIMHQPAPHNSLHYFINTTFNYPTMAEAYRVAALNGLNRAKGN